MTTQTRESRYDAFCKELTELCRRHGVQLATDGYDNICVEESDKDGSPIWIQNLPKNDIADTPSNYSIEWMERQQQADAK